MLARMACIFPGDPSAELNLIPVDRVVAGIVAALKRPQAIGERVHLATDNRITSEQIQRIVAEELGVQVKLAEPTLHRNVTLPVLTRLLKSVKQERLANALEKLGTIFGGYSEWGQPVHEVGNDVRVLGLSAERPNTEHAFRMLCRHNRYVQNYGQVREPDEISRREWVWWEVIVALEDAHRRPGGRACRRSSSAPPSRPRSISRASNGGESGAGARPRRRYLYSALKVLTAAVEGLPRLLRLAPRVPPRFVAGRLELLEELLALGALFQLGELLLDLLPGVAAELGRLGLEPLEVLVPGVELGLQLLDVEIPLRRGGRGRRRFGRRLGGGPARRRRLLRGLRSRLPGCRFLRGRHEFSSPVARGRRLGPGVGTPPPRSSAQASAIDPPAASGTK